MIEAKTASAAAATEEANRMYALYRQGGQERRMAPHIVDSEPACPYDGCGQSLQAIDFRLEVLGRADRYPLVRAWWDDTGFAGRCPHCGGWIHFTIHAKRAVTAEEAARYPRLPENWFEGATIL